MCVVVCDLETTKILVREEEAKAHERALAPREKEVQMFYVKGALKFKCPPPAFQGIDPLIMLLHIFRGSPQFLQTKSNV